MSLRTSSVLAALCLSTLLAANAAQAAPTALSTGFAFECTVPAAGNFDCVLLKQKFLADLGVSENPGSPLKVSVSRVPVLNGYSYKTVISDAGTDSSLAHTTFVSDGLSSTAAVDEVNGVLQKDVHYLVPKPDAPKPSGPSSDGRWLLTPNASFNIQAATDVPAAINASAGVNFNYSGSRNRYIAGANGSFSRQSMPVTVENKVEQYGVNSYTMNANAAAVLGIDRQNHFNAGAGVAAKRSPTYNIDSQLSAAVGVEYNAHPFLTEKDPDALAVGCSIGPAYYNFSVPNVLEKSQFLAIAQSCAITGSILLDKKRGTVITGTVGETKILNAPNILTGNIMLTAQIRPTDRITIAPQVMITAQTQSVTTASSKYVPDLTGESPQQIANDEFTYAARSSAGSPFSISGYLTFSYKFGDGANRASQDQRGASLQ